VNNNPTDSNNRSRSLSSNSEYTQTQSQTVYTLHASSRLNKIAIHRCVRISAHVTLTFLRYFLSSSVSVCQPSTVCWRCHRDNTSSCLFQQQITISTFVSMFSYIHQLVTCNTSHISNICSFVRLCTNHSHLKSSKSESDIARSEVITCITMTSRNSTV